jgi:hypothetical protein
LHIRQFHKAKCLLNTVETVFFDRGDEAFVAKWKHSPAMKQGLVPVVKGLRFQTNHECSHEERA